MPLNGGGVALCYDASNGCRTLLQQRFEIDDRRIHLVRHGNLPQFLVRLGVVFRSTQQAGLGT